MKQYLKLGLKTAIVGLVVGIIYLAWFHTGDPYYAGTHTARFVFWAAIVPTTLSICTVIFFLFGVVTGMMAKNRPAIIAIGVNLCAVYVAAIGYLNLVTGGDASGGMFNDVFIRTTGVLFMVSALGLFFWRNEARIATIILSVAATLEVQLAGSFLWTLMAGAFFLPPAIFLMIPKIAKEFYHSKR